MTKVNDHGAALTRQRVLQALCLATESLARAYKLTEDEPVAARRALPSGMAPKTVIEAGGRRPGDSEDSRGATVVWVYVASTDGLARLARQFGLALFKIGTVRGSVEVRMAELRSTRYAGCTMGDAGIVEEIGFDKWKTVRLVARRPIDARIIVDRRLVRVELTDMSHAAFEAALRERLEPLSLLGRHAQGRGRDQVSTRRWTPALHSAGRPAEASEIYNFRPLRDGTRLLEIIEDIIGPRESDGDPIFATRASNRDAKTRQKTARPCGTIVSPAPMTAPQIAAMRARLRTAARYV